MRLRAVFVKCCEYYSGQPAFVLYNLQSAVATKSVSAANTKKLSLYTLLAEHIYDFHNKC
jgi:hypothetical protein